jgi:TonB-linked SusC/RagA family outer membrane protein
MSKFFRVLSFLFIVSLQSFAQTQTIKGTITDESGKGIKGVNILAKGNKKGTQTNEEGKFSINVKSEGNVDLILSAVGFKNAIVTASGNKEVSVVMTQDVVVQDEVVVNVGYGTLKKREVSSAVSSITAKDIKDVPINNAAEALTGRLAGVQVTTAEGAPDADVKVRVRGGGSITQSNDPLYIVDGVQSENGLSTISPQDIQSIDVLKDAAATAIYGARGANGVIIVTTKNGKQGKLSVNFNSAIGMKKLSTELEVLDPYEFVIWEYERTRGGDATAQSSFATKYGTTWDTLANYKNQTPVDWQKLVLGRTGIVANNSVSVSGGSKLVSFTAGYTNNYEKAIVQNSNYKRNLFNGKLDYKPLKNLKIGLSGRYISQDVQGAGVSDASGAAYNRLRNAIKYRPYALQAVEVDTSGEENPGNNLFLINPLVLNDNEYRLKTTRAINVTAYASYNLSKKITFKTTFGYEKSNLTDRQFSDSVTSISRIDGRALPYVQLDTTIKKQFTNSNVVTVKLNFQKVHELDIVAGQEIVIAKASSSMNQWRYFPQFTGHDVAFSNTSMGEYKTNYPIIKKYESTLLSFFSRANYSFDKRYILSLNLRADGSSKFAAGQKWGYFPSASVAWRVVKEKFMDKLKAVSDLKLRFSYGAVGNNRIDDYLYLSTFATSPYYYGINGQPVFGYTPNYLPNALLKWETTISKNIGLDLSLFQDRLGLTVDVYENKTKDLLLNVPIAPTFGYSTQLQNVGSTRNRGIEVQLTAGIIKNKKFSWTATFNLSSNKNIITELGVNQYSINANSLEIPGKLYDYVAQIGQPVGAIYGYVTDGFYKVNDFNYDPATQAYTLKPGVVDNSKIIGAVQPGMIKFKDLNGDTVVNADHDATIIGNATPKLSGGFNQQFTYKNWDLSIFVNFVYGNSILNMNKLEFSNGYTPNSNLLAIMKDRWRTIDAQGQVVNDPVQLAALNVNAKLWRPVSSGGASFQVHSWAVEDGSFIRINNISLGYNFPVKAIKGLGISKLRLYVTGNNLGIITSYTGYDPEVNARRSNPLTPGVDYSAYPKSRLYMFGLNATF